MSSETLQFQSGPLMSAIDNFMKFSSKRLKLDSTSALDSNVVSSLDGQSSTSSMLNCQDEKPLMTFGITDYPSLGFREELGMVGGMMGGEGGGLASSYPLGALSKFISSVVGEKLPPSADMDSGEGGREGGRRGMSECESLKPLLVPADACTLYIPYLPDYKSHRCISRTPRYGL